MSSLKNPFSDPNAHAQKDKTSTLTTTFFVTCDVRKTYATPLGWPGNRRAHPEKVLLSRRVQLARAR
jgi:hypothetical protein